MSFIEDKETPDIVGVDTKNGVLQNGNEHVETPRRVEPEKSAPTQKDTTEFYEALERARDLTIGFAAVAQGVEIENSMRRRQTLKDALLDLIEACERSGCQSF
jgi:hypothetical protein